MPIVKPKNVRLLFDREAVDLKLHESSVKSIQSVSLGRE